MDEVLKRRLVGALVLLAGCFAVASLLPKPAPQDDGLVRYDLRTGAPVGAVPAEPRPALKVDETLGEPEGWFVQVASFGDQGRARTSLQQLYGRGLPAIIQSVTVGNALMYRVRLGPFEGEARAREVLALVGTEYRDARLVPPAEPPSGAPEPSAN